ncbi:MAG: FAD binding domain-containing protein [Eubacteriales bacterium]|nr:FAD binding domain-containing protein [Eubacteriales bacterium]
MALPEMTYVRAKSLDEACKYASENSARTAVMAGGTDVILQTKELVLQNMGIDTLLDIKEIPGLNRLDFVEGEGLKIGSLTKLYDIQSSEIVKEHIPAVADAAHYVASPQVRRKGTMAGNICNASPSADTASILLAMNAVIKTHSVKGDREIPMSEFFQGFKKTAIDKEAGEIVTEIDIPELKKGEGSAYFKHAIRKAMDLAIIGVAAWVRMDGNKIEDVRLAVGGAAITPIRLPEAEAILKGNELSDELLEKAGVKASQEISPISDVRASAEYRTDMVRVYTKRAVNKAVETMR